MTSDPAATRDQRIASLKIIDEYYWMLLRHLTIHTRARLGDAGMRALGEGFRLAGRYRGQSMAEDPATLASGNDALSLLRAWDVADLAFANPDSVLEVEGGPAAATVMLPSVPGSEYFSRRGGADILASYWSNTLQGIAEGFDEEMSVTHTEIPADGSGPLAITFSYAGDTTGASEEMPRDRLADVASSILFSRRTFGVFGAMGMYVARAMEENFDATAEKLMREALYDFGYERGEGMKEEAVSSEMPLDFETWTDIISRRDPNSTCFVFKGSSHVSPGVMHTTCTYCPCAEVWAEEGHQGLAFGYIYDTEVHRGLVEAFDPNGVVGWSKVKTRGDKVCDFRFILPSLVTGSDPEWAQQQGRLRAPVEG